MQAHFEVLGIESSLQNDRTLRCLAGSLALACRFQAMVYGIPQQMREQIAHETTEL